MNWGYETEPEPGLDGRTVVWPRGKVLGGSGSINGLVFLRGAPSDYDDWAAARRARLGLQGRAALFQADGALRRRRQRMARHRRPDDGVEHQAALDDGKAFVEACERLQYPRNPDFNGERIDGVGFAPLNVHNGWRRSTAVGYLKPNLGRKNLELMTNTHVRRILFEGKRAIGVEVERDGQIQRIGARRELIISGGAINSPVLLLASGIGPAAELTKLGIDVKHDLPGVGKNLQDHYQSSFTFKTSATDTLNEAVMSPVKSAKLALDWLFTGDRASSRSARPRRRCSAKSIAVRAGARPAVPVPELLDRTDLHDGLHRWPGFTFIFSVCRPKSRGEITLRDARGAHAAAHSGQLLERSGRHAHHAGGASGSPARSSPPSRSAR